jgi:hypothetical protein
VPTRSTDKPGQPLNNPKHQPGGTRWIPPQAPHLRIPIFPHRTHRSYGICKYGAVVGQHSLENVDTVRSCRVDITTSKEDQHCSACIREVGVCFGYLYHGIANHFLSFQGSQVLSFLSIRLLDLLASYHYHLAYIIRYGHLLRRQRPQAVHYHCPPDSSRRNAHLRPRRTRYLWVRRRKSRRD